MPCRVGITTDLEKRKAYWESRVHSLSNWLLLGSCRSRAQAQAHETRYSIAYKCQAAPGGRDSGGSWHVYRFNYTRLKS